MLHGSLTQPCSWCIQLKLLRIHWFHLSTFQPAKGPVENRGVRDRLFWWHLRCQHKPGWQNWFVCWWRPHFCFQGGTTSSFIQWQGNCTLSKTSWDWWLAACQARVGKLWNSKENCRLSCQHGDRACNSAIIPTSEDGFSVINRIEICFVPLPQNCWFSLLNCFRRETDLVVWTWLEVVFLSFLCRRVPLLASTA